MQLATCTDSEVEAALLRLLDPEAPVVLRRPPVQVPRQPPELLSRAEKAAQLQRVVAARAMLAAYEAELILGLAEDTPDTLDPPPDHPGARKGT
jgi:hypothetical protein